MLENGRADRKAEAQVPLASDALRLTDIIGLDELQRIQDAFSLATGVGSVITDTEGAPLTSPSNFQGVCALVRDTEAGNDRCLRSAKLLSEKSARSRRPSKQQCLSCGFLDACAPILVGGRHLGNWMVGQINAFGVDEDEILQISQAIGADPEAMLRAFATQPVMTPERFQALVDHVWTLARTIADLGWRNQTLQGEVGRRRLAEARLTASQQRYRIVADNTYDWESWISEDGEVLYCSPSCERISGHPPQTFVKDPKFFLSLVHKDDLDNWQARMRRVGDEEAEPFDFRMFRKDGRMAWINQTQRRVRDKYGNDLGVRVSMRDVTDRKFMERQLQYEALHDPLTGLSNRVLLLDRLAQAMERSRRRDNYYYAVIFMDLDRFKVINDSLGHVVGDELLQQVAERLLTCVRELDTVARFGGDEFVLLLEEMGSPREAIRIIKRVRAALREAFTVQERDLQISASFGVVLSPTAYDTPQPLLRNANLAMHRAKESGRDRLKVFNARMLETAVQAMTLESDMRAGIGTEQFRIVYQPILCLESDRPIGFEALARWNHPDKGAIPPSVFIPMAEETGLIIPLGQWALREACATFASWRASTPAARDMVLSVNLSCRQFSQFNLVHDVRQALEDTGLPPDRLKLEITESAIMDRADQALEMLRRLKSLGITVSVDDFGTGYSSLSYLQRLPLDNLKIDLSFISRMHENQESVEIVKAIIDLAHSLKMEVVAEGVELDDHCAQLKSLDCEFGQGFLFSRPMERDDAEAYIRAF